MRRAPTSIRKPRDEAYLLERSIPEPNTGCWLWLGALTKDGYAVIRMLPFVRAHSLACFLKHGAAPAGTEVDHACRMRCCVNPDHVRYRTHAENTRYSPHPNAQKTHCLNGHPLSGDNVRFTKKRTRAGYARTCKECERQRHRERKRNARNGSRQNQ